MRFIYDTVSDSVFSPDLDAAQSSELQSALSAALRRNDPVRTVARILLEVANQPSKRGHPIRPIKTERLSKIRPGNAKMTLRKILYSGGEIITTEDAAHAVLEYAAELGNRGRASTLRVPAAGLSGGETFVELLLGPASQLTSEPVDSAVTPPDDTKFLQELRARIASPARPWDDNQLDPEI